MTTKSATLEHLLWTSSTIGIGIVNSQRKLIEANPTFCNIYGYSLDELLHQSVDKLAPQHFRDQAQLHYQNYVNGDAYKGYQFIQRQDGSRQYVQLSTDAITLDSEEPGQLITMTALPFPEARTKVLPEIADSLSNVFLFECNALGQCLRSNKAAQQRLDIHPQEFLRQSVAIYSGHIQRTVPIAELLSERAHWENSEWQLYPESTRSQWMLVNARVSERNTTVVCLVSIQEQKRLEDTLTKILKTERASNEHLQHFLCGATHDLKAPTASLLGLLNIFQNEEDEEGKELYLRLMEKSLHRLNEFIYEIVDYSKNKDRRLRQESIDFEKLVNDVFDNLGYSAQAVQIERVINVHQSGTFYSDPHNVNVILSNLISNAYKYSSTHRRSSEVRVSIFASEREATIQVADNGLGIAKEHLNKIFDMFYRASVQESGSGLGLYLVKEVIDKMKGSIHVDSTLGEGTTFTVRLPAVLLAPSQEQMSLNL
ncbi:PAS domain-containing sensor histidine kinase [Tunicatimonas pelagia]|uniref:PAS domain-containing sensor histidine kinase n=1 Tax=Tunicatimonas pelagia TaxID=931531 RepID=UPI00266629F3|nr:ATP-binding protein [Tunicatimonas pelagia]WKN42224.1 ATP-binding protein [Tunicatimonas pelagia]